MLYVRGIRAPSAAAAPVDGCFSGGIYLARFFYGILCMADFAAAGSWHLFFLQKPDLLQKNERIRGMV